MHGDFEQDMLLGGEAMVTLPGESLPAERRRAHAESVADMSGALLAHLRA